MKKKKEDVNILCKKTAPKKIPIQSHLENVILSSYDSDTGHSVYTLPPSGLSPQTNTRTRCIAVTSSNKDSKQCKCKSVKGSVYCTRHKNMFGK